MYKTVNLKSKLFTILTNQNSCDEAREIGCILTRADQKTGGAL